MGLDTAKHHPAKRWSETFRLGATCLAQYEYAACSCGLTFVVDYWTRDRLWTAEDDVDDSVRHFNVSLARRPDRLEAVPVDAARCRTVPLPEVRPEVAEAEWLEHNTGRRRPTAMGDALGMFRALGRKGGVGNRKRVRQVA